MVGDDHVVVGIGRMSVLELFKTRLVPHRVLVQNGLDGQQNRLESLAACPLGTRPRPQQRQAHFPAAVEVGVVPDVLVGVDKVHPGWCVRVGWWKDNVKAKETKFIRGVFTALNHGFDGLNVVIVGNGNSVQGVFFNREDVVQNPLGSVHDNPVWLYIQ